MHASSPALSDRSCSRSSSVFPLLLLVALAGSCGGSAGSGGQSGIPGQEESKPGGGTFFVDVNGGGGRSTLHLAEVLWGRLVDVHEIDGSGRRIETPIFRDFVIEPGVLTNGSSYVLDRNPVTQRERLTIQARKTGVPDTSAFDQLLAAASDALPQVVQKNVSSSPPFTSVPRNACVVLRFDDCLDDDADGAQNLPNTVQVESVTGLLPSTEREERVNALGQATIGDTGHFWAAPFERSKEFGGRGWPPAFSADALALRSKGLPAQSTTLAVVATDAKLTKAQANRLAVMAQTGLARAIYPVHTPLDGDVVFAAASGQKPLADPVTAMSEPGMGAANVLARAVARGVYEATALPFAGSLPSWKDKFKRA